MISEGSMPNTEWPEKINDLTDISCGSLEKFGLVLTTEGLREQIVWGVFPDVMFTDEN